MIVWCKTNSPGSVPEKYLDPLASVTQDMMIPLTVGESYVVYAISFRLDQVHYAVCDCVKLIVYF